MNSGQEDNLALGWFLSVLVWYAAIFYVFGLARIFPESLQYPFLSSVALISIVYWMGFLAVSLWRRCDRLGRDLASLRTWCPGRETPATLPEVSGAQGDTKGVRRSRARSSGIGAGGATSSDGIGNARGGNGEERNCSPK